MREAKHFSVSAINFKQSFIFFLCIYWLWKHCSQEVFLSKNKSLRFKSVFSVHDFLIKLGSLNQSLIQKGKLLTMIHTLLNVVF